VAEWTDPYQGKKAEWRALTREPESPEYQYTSVEMSRELYHTCVALATMRAVSSKGYSPTFFLPILTESPIANQFLSASLLSPK
jgi:hypothetical protein